MSKVNKISLDERLKNLYRGYASDNAYNLCIVQKMADMPIRTYLKDFEDEYTKLMELLTLKEEEMECATYRDIATKVHLLQQLPETPLNDYMKTEVLRILALPFLRCYERKMWIYEKYRKN